MNGYDFTQKVRQTLARAREEAVALDHEFVGTEHILLGLLAEQASLSAAVLQNLGADADGLRAITLRLLQRGKRPVAADHPLPYTSRAKRVLELAMLEAAELMHAYVGTEHLLLGLIREEKGIAAQVLDNAGITLARARTETLRLLGSAPANAAADTPSKPPAERTAPPTASTHEHLAWMRLSQAIEVCQRLGTPVTLTPEADGSLTVPFGPDLVVSIDLPRDLRLRRREVTRPTAPPPPSPPQELA